MYDSTIANRNKTTRVKLATASLPADRTVIPVPAKSPETARTNPPKPRLRLSEQMYPRLACSKVKVAEGQAPKLLGQALQPTVASSTL
ncbi:hypothetical protein AUI46_04980 [archaeon 13_1_40CM_2_52_13]|nr:MAG: hypothetical protein AUI46_04980 [archaeon 13_1_40CM_2_52_13]OLE68492.1 MAG: hypothetical protein AUF78_15850 [archaeon 13_1_20CM_2_51_12]